MYVRRADLRPDHLAGCAISPWARSFYAPRTVTEMRRLLAGKHQAKQRRYDRKAVCRGLADWRDEAAELDE